MPTSGMHVSCVKTDKNYDYKGFLTFVKVDSVYQFMVPTTNLSLLRIQEAGSSPLSLFIPKSENQI